MTSDHNLLDRMKSLIQVTRRVHIKDAAAMLDLDHVTFLKKVMEWGKTIPFKIDGDDIVVDDVTMVIDSIDRQFATWSDDSKKIDDGIDDDVKAIKKSSDPLSVIRILYDKRENIPDWREFRTKYTAPFCQACGRRGIPVCITHISEGFYGLPDMMRNLRGDVTYCAECIARRRANLLKKHQARNTRKVNWCGVCRDIFFIEEPVCPRCKAPPTRIVDFPSKEIAEALPKREFIISKER